VFSRAILPYRKGTIIEQRGATASNYQRRDGIAPNSNIKSATAAARQAKNFLWQHRLEEDVVECEIEVPAGAVNLVHAGDRIQGQFGHWGPEGYSGWTNFRVLERRVKPELRSSPPAVYRVHLKLSPQEPAEPTCSYPRTPSATYYPLGAHHCHDQFDLCVNTSEDGVVYYLRPGLFYPTTPMPGYFDMTWHFGEWQQGGAGTIDYAGDCVANTLQFIVVGNGTLEVHTAAYPSGSRPMSAYFFSPTTGASTSLGTFTSGATVTATISDTVAPSDCVRVVRFHDGPGSPCGGKWGWSQAVWTQT